MKPKPIVWPWVLLLFAFVLWAQEDLSQKPIEIRDVAPGGSRNAREIVEALRQSPTVRDQCLKTPEAMLDVALNGYRVPVDCRLWHLWYRAQEITR